MGPLTHPLFEDVQLPFAKRVKISIWSAFAITAFLVTLLMAMYVAINVCFMFGGMRGPEQTLIYLAKTIPWFAGVAFVFVGSTALLVSLSFGHANRPRRISVSEDTFVVETVSSKRHVPFSECLWTMPAMACDGAYFYPPKQKLIVICWSDGKSFGTFACGFSEDAYKLWKSFLTLRKVSFKAPAPITAWLMWLSAGSVGGGLLGSLLGVVAAYLTRQPMWVAAWGFLGFVDGFTWGILGAAVVFSSSEHCRRVKTPRWQRRAVHLIVMPVAGFGLGLKIGLIEGLSGAFVTGALNAALFAFGSWRFESVLRRKVEEDDAFPGERSSASSFTEGLRR